MTHLLSAKDLTYRSKKPGFFERKPRQPFILGPVDISINKAETIAIIGGNRSGKSLLAKLLCGALSPTAGSIQFNHEGMQCDPQENQNWQRCHQMATNQVGSPPNGNVRAERFSAFVAFITHLTGQ